MTPWQTLRRAILPQAARVALPPLSNSFISTVKDTSLAATIQVPGCSARRAVNYLANAGGVYHRRVVNLLGNGDRLIGTAKLF